MGATISNEYKSEVQPEQLRLKELSPNSISAIKQMFDKNQPGCLLDKNQLMSTFNIAKRETDILFDYFDMDENSKIDKYEFTCAIAMIVHASLNLRSQFLFKVYDFASSGYLTRDDLVHLERTLIAALNLPIKSDEIDAKVEQLIRNADIDKDDKLSLREFQAYVMRNREMLSILNAYSCLLSSNPIKGSTHKERVEERKEDSEEEEDEVALSRHEREKEEEDSYKEEKSDEKKGKDVVADIDEDDGFGAGDECDPDLFDELKKNKIAKEKTEEAVNIKKGVEFGNGFVEEQVQGDQFSAVKPWVTNAINTVPSTFRPSKLDGKIPDASLELEFVHGYRCHDTRNNLRYAANGDFIYHTAAIGIVYNKTEHKQALFNEHFDDITSLAVHPNKTIVATGEMGPYPLISIWDTAENKALVRIREPLTKGINHLAFSRDGKYLAATAADDTHIIAVFDWKKGTTENIAKVTNPRLKNQKTQFKGPVIGTCEGGRADILNICFNKAGDTVACACVKEVNFISIAATGLKKKKATGLKADDLTSIMCCAFINTVLVCGTMKGKLLVCAGTQFTQSIKAHTQAMNSIWVRDNDIGFITGGSDSFVLTWDTKYNITSRYSIINDKINSLNPRVRSICEDSAGNLLIGTRGGEIIEVSNGVPTVYLRGHWDKELWGLCVHPSNDTYYTVGEDKLLGVWSIEAMKLVQYCVLEEEATSIDIAPNGKELAIGCESGNVYIYDSATLKKKLLKKEATQMAIEELKYSPCGKYLASGGIDKDTTGFMHLFVYDVSANYKRIQKMKGHQSRITHIDWSSDSQYLQSNSQAYELLYHSLTTGNQITKISSMKDTEWQTWTCVLGWPVIGIWPECASGDDINASDVDKSRRVIVTADDYSKVKLFRYPSPIERAAFNQYNGHSSHVTCVRFSSNNKHVISIGGNDKAVFQFKFSFNEEAAGEAEELEALDANQANPDDDEREAYFKVEEIEGTEFGANKPWIGELQASSPKIKVDKNSGNPPIENIKKLNYVFGYRAFDTRMNVKYTGEENKIVYHTAALGVVIDRVTNKQRFFTKHEEDIVSLAIHPNGTTVATGQMAAKGQAKTIDLYVWDITTLPETTNVLASERPTPVEGVSNLKGSLLRAIRILQFSPDGAKLLGGGQDDFNSIAVFDTSNLTKVFLIGTCKVDGARVLDAIWTSNTDFITVGPKHIKFFKVSGRNITSSKGVFGKIKIEPLVSVAYAFNKLFTGTDKGNLITWEGANASSLKNICKNGALFTLYYYNKEKVLFAGGFDGVIIGFSNAKLEERYRIDIRKVTNTPCDVGIRSLDANSKGELLVGSKGGEIVEISLQSQTLIRSIMKSHFENELWALTINPANCFEVASGGGDKTLRIWDLKTYREKKFMMFPEDFRAIDWSRNGEFIVIGTMPGLIYYIKVASMTRSSPFKSIFYAEPSTKKQDDKDKWIQELKISPNNEYVAFGSHCGIGGSFSKIQVLQVTGNDKAPLKAYVTVDPKITSALTHLDWSADNDRIVCNSLAFELKHISIGAKSVIKSSSCVWEPELWSTWTCLFGFPVQGIWPPASTGYIVNYTCLSNSKKVIATGDDFSLVKLFKAPCVVEHASYKAYGGHSSHVPKVRFTPDDRFLVSVGGNDKSVFIWETDFGSNQQEEENEEDQAEEQVEEQYEQQEEEQPEEEEEEITLKPQKKVPSSSATKQNKELVMSPTESIPAPSKKPNAKTKEDKSKTPQSKSSLSQLKAKRQPQVIEEEEQEDEEYEDEEQIEAEEEEIKPLKLGKNIDTPLSRTPQSNTRSPVKMMTKTKVKVSQNYFNVEEKGEMVGDNAGNPDDNALTTEQWRSTVELPDNIALITPDDKKPNLSLRLDYVFGYRTKDNRNNLKYLDQSTIVYHAGNLGIVHDLTSNTQSYFTGHKAEILSFALDPTKTFIATGDGSTNPESTTQSHLIIWQSANLQEVTRFTLPVNGINALAFSPSGEKILCGCLDSKHMIYVMHLPQKEVIASIENGSMKLLDLAFKSETEFATVGIKQFKFWTVKGKELTVKEGVFIEKVDSALGVITLFEDRFITGSGTGQLLLWKDDTITFGKKVHTSNIDALYTNKHVIISGGRDMKIVVMEQNLNELCRISLDIAKLDSVNCMPRSLDISDNTSKKILLGTIASEIYELSFDEEKFSVNYTAKCHLAAHYSPSSKVSNEVTGLLYLQSQSLFCSIGEDSTLRFWNAKTNQQENFLRFDIDENNNPKLDFKPSAVSVNSDETVLAVGFNEGSIQFYSTSDYSVINLMSFRKYPVFQLKYSPNGLFLASATQDETETNIIDIFSTKDYSLISTLKGHNDVINRIDWSVDSSFISTSSLKGELRLFSIKGSQITRYADSKNEEWQSWTRSFGWPLMGYYDSGACKVTACERIDKAFDNDEKVIVIGDENGAVKIYKYPVMASNQKCVKGEQCHLNQVTQLKMAEKGMENSVLTSGSDGSIFKWTIVQK